MSQSVEEEIRRWHSESELLDAAQTFMAEQCGSAKDMPPEERQKFYQELGLLVAFCHHVWHR